MWFRGWFNGGKRFSSQYSFTPSCKQELCLACKASDWEISQHASWCKWSGRTSNSNCNKTWSRWSGCFPYQENGPQKVGTYVHLNSPKLVVVQSLTWAEEPLILCYIYLVCFWTCFNSSLNAPLKFMSSLPSKFRSSMQSGHFFFLILLQKMCNMLVYRVIRFIFCMFTLPYVAKWRQWIVK